MIFVNQCSNVESEKSATRNVSVEWIEADAMNLPFPDAAFDLVTVAFGLRNIAETDRGLI